MRFAESNRPAAGPSKNVELQAEFQVRDYGPFRCPPWARSWLPRRIRARARPQLNAEKGRHFRETTDRRAGVFARSLISTDP
jgi:hypothetical protein